MKVLVTGGAGFIGSNFIKWLHKTDKSVHITNLDALTYAGNLKNLSEIESSNRYKFVQGNVCDANITDSLVANADILINFAAETHVDRSIKDPQPFFKTNIIGTLNLLESVRKNSKKIKFIQISTDEVYGSLGETGKFTEESAIHPNNPYAVSKACADEIILNCRKAYGLETIITRCSNNYGPSQYPEKLIPFMVKRALENKTLPVYGDGLHIRDWIHVEDYARGIWLASTKGGAGEIYNFGANCEQKNLDVIKRILKILNKPESSIEFVQDRPGHDRRYAMDASKALQKLGWKPEIPFEEGLESAVKSYITK